MGHNDVHGAILVKLVRLFGWLAGLPISPLSQLENDVRLEPSIPTGEVKIFDFFLMLQFV